MFITRVEVITNFKTDIMKGLNSILRRVLDEQHGHAASLVEGTANYKATQEAFCREVAGGVHEAVKNLLNKESWISGQMGFSKPRSERDQQDSTATWFAVLI
jgi:hypothetical protein